MRQSASRTSKLHRNHLRSILPPLCQILPFRIHPQDQLFLVCPIAGFELLLKHNGIPNIIKCPKVDKVVTIISRSKTFIKFGFMLPYPFHKVRGNPNVKDRMVFIGEDVDVGSAHAGSYKNGQNVTQQASGKVTADCHGHKVPSQ